jgi:hypothetical protein
MFCSYNIFIYYKNKNKLDKTYFLDLDIESLTFFLCSDVTSVEAQELQIISGK